MKQSKKILKTAVLSASYRYFR